MGEYTVNPRDGENVLSLITHMLDQRISIAIQDTIFYNTESYL